MSDTKEKKEKNRKIEKWIKGTVVLCLVIVLLVPAVISVWLGVKMAGLETQLSELRDEVLWLETAWAESSGGQQQLLPEGEAVELSEEDSIRAWEEQADSTPASKPSANGIRKVYLTFDDGPSIYTDEILDILKEYNVKATFFVVAEGKESYEDAYRRILEEGHTLGMHSYSHVYREIYQSKEAFIQDVNKLQDYLHEVTGEYPDFYRFPGGSSNRVSTVNMQELEGYLNEIDVTWYDWNISSGDATGHLGKDQIVRNCTAYLSGYDEAVILLHDAGDKRSTVQALPEIIEKILAMEDTVIAPITEDTVPIQHGKTK